jgi:hypothetical protein
VCWALDNCAVYRLAMMAAPGAWPATDLPLDELVMRRFARTIVARPQ